MTQHTTKKKKKKTAPDLSESRGFASKYAAASPSSSSSPSKEEQYSHRRALQQAFAGAGVGPGFYGGGGVGGVDPFSFVFGPDARFPFVVPPSTTVEPLGEAGAPSPAPLDGSPSPAPELPPKKKEKAPAPLFNYFSNANHSTFSTTWLAIKAAHLDEYLNRTDLSITFFAPTNAAWEKRLPSITRDLGLDVKGLLSEGKSQVLNEILKYHMLSVKMDFERLSSQSRVTTTANLCSDAKDLEIAEGGAGNGPDAGRGKIALLTSGDGYATLLDRGVKVNRSIVYAIDDVLIPSAVTVPTMQALGQKDMPKMSAEVWADKDLIEHLASVSSGGAAAPAAQPLPSEFRKHRNSHSSNGGPSSSSSSGSNSSSKNKKKRSDDEGSDGGDFDDGAPVSVRSADNGADDTSSDATGN